MSWTDRYADKVMTLEAAAALVRRGDRVMGGLPEPAAFLLALAEREDLADVEVFLGAPRHGGVAAAANPGIRLYAGFLTEALRTAKVSVETLPVHFSGVPAFIRRWQPRVRVVLVAEPTHDGFVHPGAAVANDDELVLGPAPSDAVVIGVVDPNQPRLPGIRYRVEDFHALVPLPADTPPPFYDSRRTSPHLDTIVGLVDELIPDEATLQSGVGGLPEAIMARLGHKRDLGVHTEVLGPGMAELLGTGAVTNRAKTHFPGETVFTIALPDALDALADHPMARLESASLVLDPREVARNHRMRCVNAVLQVDLYGQGNAEMLNGVQYSGVGGQLDFLRACTYADDALSILVLESTTARGAVSRIVGHLQPNATTGGRYETQVVVTEHGVAWLRDATMRQKAQRLIDIAHPDHRGWLTDQAKDVGLL
ncbi:MAG: acetyl-CoA hydrolase/transferase C-terminal domain-containing protein [Acidimicrobiales bacterium]